jgi:hypothetical protein
MATEPYVIRPGDYLTAIAYFRRVDVAAIWKDPSNATLRDLRDNPEMLAPGDVLYVPSVKPKWLPVNVGENNKFVATLWKVTVQVAFKDSEGQPFANKTVRLQPKFTSEDPTTDGDGTLKIQVPVSIRFIDATIVDAQVTFRIRIGHLDPHDVDSGTLSRLRQLGYVADETHLIATDRPYLREFEANGTTLSRAVASFQAERGQEVSGSLDDDLRGRIRQEYGH